MKHIYNEWSTEIYTCRIDYSNDNSQYAQINSAERDAHELSLGGNTKITLCPSTPPSSRISGSTDPSSMVEVSPLQQHISTTTLQVFALRDIQRFTSVERELGIEVQNNYHKNLEMM
jgi:hypothetical protein